jgi:pyruvate/2-oxoglutarate dehydrogenase complex dihydrolipoamide acyltransferase (E2) component
VKLPQLGETSQAIAILGWLAEVGEEVSSDQPLVEVETDKVETEVTATTSGILVERLVSIGDEVLPGTSLFVIEDGFGDE